jgi:iron(III) transport system permease protein
MLAWLPWLMPGIVMGIGLLWAYALMPGPIQIYGTIWALFFAYMALGMPLSVRIMGDSYRQLSFDLEECSRVHGASWWQTLWRIMIALAWPAFAVGWILTFFGILRELSASILLYSVGSEVLSVELVKLWMNGGAEKVSVIGLLAMLLVILFRLVQIKLLNRRIGITV